MNIRYPIYEGVYRILTLKKQGLKKIYLVKGRSLISANGESTVDGIHFTDCGFEQYVDAILPILKKAINHKKK